MADENIGEHFPKRRGRPPSRIRALADNACFEEVKDLESRSEINRDAVSIDRASR